MDYFLAIDGVQHGPFPTSELLARGMKPDTLVWHDGMPQWLPAASVPELQDILSPPPPPPPPQFLQNGFRPADFGPSTAPPPSQLGYAQPPPANANFPSKRIPAGVLAITLGWLGIHKFYLGMTAPGMAMLLITLATCCPTHGVSFLAMAVVGIIEGVIYLSKTDLEFYQTYIVQRRPLF